ncbi:MAG: MFS transporter, partial [Oscillospiraceae bacterium]|nr:MFS transporter [Oscillospiraceae bacterium]
IVTFLIFLPSNAINTYLFYIVKYLGGGTKDQGIVYFVQAIVEIPALMLFPVLIRKFKSKYLMLFASFNYLIRMILIYLAPNITSLILIYIFQSITYAIYFPNMRHYVDKHSPKELKATAQSFVESFGIGLSGVLGNLFGGLIINYYSLKSMLFICIILSLIALIFLIYVVISSKNE